MRNNSRLETLYQSVANQAFQFCLKYERKTEFRRLCEIVRQHLASSSKYSHQPHSINLNEPETLQRYLDTRLVQLNAAISLDLWQEAYRSIEDIHTLLSVSRKAPKSHMMVLYYEKLSDIFLVGQNYLFHSAAKAKHYSTLLSSGKATENTNRYAPVFLILPLDLLHWSYFRPCVSQCRLSEKKEIRLNHHNLRTTVVLPSVSHFFCKIPRPRPAPVS